jgi:hypothetical protein
MVKSMNYDKKILQRINENGIPFQYAVIRHLEDLFISKKSNWALESCELPVPPDRRIDFVLSYRNKKIIKAFIVGECKRVNPAFGSWFFTSTPYIARDYPSNRLCFDQFFQSGNSQSLHEITSIPSSDPIYDIGMPFRLPDKSGNSCKGDNDRDAIEKAMTQVIGGTNGLIRSLFDHNNLATVHSPTPLIPLIVTTATMCSAENAEIRNASIETGNLELADLGPVQEQPWLWFRYNQTPRLQEIAEPQVKVQDKFKQLLSKYSRTVGISSGSGIASFLDSLELILN